MEHFLKKCEYYQGLKPSTHQWCEEKICGPIREPSNAFSNVSFLIIGIYIIAHCSKKKFAHLRVLGIFSILIGLMSGVYHATSSFEGEVLDYSSMFLMSTYFVCANLARLYQWSGARLKWWALGIFVVSVGGILLLEVVGAIFFGLQLAFAFWLELLLWKRSVVNYGYRPFLLSSLLFAIAYLFWNLDRLKILCDPNNHILTGHAVWHILNAVAILFIYRFYSQFELRNERKQI